MNNTHDFLRKRNNPQVSQTEMDGEHDTDTTAQKKYNHIFYESAETLAHELGLVVADNANVKSVCEGHNNCTTKPAGRAYA
jgi:hypothetical protein